MSFPGLLRQETGRLRLPAWREIVVYGSEEALPGRREVLVLKLVQALEEFSPGKRGGLPAEISLETGPLGCPVLRLGGERGPGISFSRADARVWGALCRAGAVGVDVALIREFVPPYPYSRAFQAGEWEWAWRQVRGRTAAAAALLWAAKEAAVKALGTGFHTRDPREVAVRLREPFAAGLWVTVYAPDEVAVWLKDREDAWLALAWHG